MPTFTVLVQREPARAGERWTTDSPETRVDAPDAVDAALAAFRQLRVMPKRQRILLWPGESTHGKPRIFHNGS